MLLRIDFRSGKPVYLQVVEQIKTAASSGTLRPGEALPSIGGLSGELRINRNAVTKAYAELEGLGLIELQPGGEYTLKESKRETRKEARRAAPVAHIAEDFGRGPAAIKTAVHYGLLVIAVAGLLPFSFAAAAIALVPLWFGAKAAAHRIVFAKRFEMPRALRILRAEAPAQPDLDSFISRMAERSAAVLGARVDLVQDRGDVLRLVHSFPTLRSARAPVQAGADFVMPVVSDDEVSAVLRLAPKAGGGEYDAADLRFLAALGEQVAVTANQFRMRRDRQESEYALDIQQGLLPREIPQAPGFSIAGAWQPARAVGGDYYDVFPLGENALALVVADVSGKGIPAALLMSNLQATVKAHASIEANPKDLCVKVNRAICKSITSGKFITFFYAVLDPVARRLTYTNAGHNPPVLVRRDGTCVKLEGSGAVLGFFPDGCHEQTTLDLLPGDRLVMFTDGITEASDAKGEEFGEDRLIAHVRESPALTASDLRNEVMQRVTQFCQDDFSDDATVLAVVAED